MPSSAGRFHSPDITRLGSNAIIRGSRGLPVNAVGTAWENLLTNDSGGMCSVELILLCNPSDTDSTEVSIAVTPSSDTGDPNVEHLIFNKTPLDPKETKQIIGSIVIPAGNSIWAKAEHNSRLNVYLHYLQEQ